MSNKKTKIEVTLLSKEEVEGKSKVLQKAGRECEKIYWTSTPSYFYGWNAAGVFRVINAGAFSYGDVSNSGAVRPVLKSDNLDELINGCKGETKDGIQIVEFGEYPHLFEKTEINNPSFLKETGKKYSLPLQKLFPKTFDLYDYPEYDYNGQKVIKVNEEHHPVKPVKLYVDRENSMLISTDVLFCSPINVDNEKHYGDFTTSQLYRYLNNEFIKDLRPDKQFKTSPDEDSIPNFMTQRANQEDIDETKRSLIERIDKLLKRNAELQAISEAMTRELSELKDEVKVKKYVRQ